MATVENFVVKVATQGVEQLSKLGSTADAVNNKMNALAGALLGVGFGAFIKGALEAADRMVDLSDATGLSVASIKAFGESMRLAGGNSKNAEKAIMTLYSAIESAADGSIKTQEAFDKVGVSINDLRNLSEADILQKTIEGLAKIPAGSERAAAATALLGRSFRGIEAQRFLETLDPQKYAEFEANAKKAADTMERFENIFATLQEGAINALTPLLDYLERINFTAKDAERLFTTVGIVFATIFGARMIAQVVAFNKALGITAGIANLIGKSPVGLLAKLLALGTTTAGITAATVALEELMTANDGVKESADAAGNALGKIVPKEPNQGPANRKVTVGIRPEEQARLDSEKRIQQSIIETRRLSEQNLTNEIQNIRANAAAEIAKIENELANTKLLTGTQREKELAQRRLEITAKAAFEEQKIRQEIENQFRDQITSIRQSTEERSRAFDLERQLLGVVGAQAEKTRAVADIEKERKKAIEDAAKVKNADIGDLARQIELINEQYEEQKRIAEGQIELQRSFEFGWNRAFSSYVDAATNAAQQAEAIFNAMTGGMNRALDNFVDSGKFSFSDLTNSIIRDIIKIQLRAAAANLFSAGANFLGFRLPGRAIGGPVSAGNPYVVGERGPEVFVPASAGNIIPNNRILRNEDAQSTIINYNISAVDALSFKQLVARDPSFIYAITEQGRKTIPQSRR